MKIYTNEFGHMTKVPAMPIYGNNLKNFRLQSQSADCLETCYVSSDTHVLLRVAK